MAHDHHSTEPPAAEAWAPRDGKADRFLDLEWVEDEDWTPDAAEVAEHWPGTGPAGAATARETQAEAPSEAENIGAVISFVAQHAPAILGAIELRRRAERLARDLARARELLRYVARTFGACWGTRGDCPPCHGRGGPGTYALDGAEAMAWTSARAWTTATTTRSTTAPRSCRS